MGPVDGNQPGVRIDEDSFLLSCVYENQIYLPLSLIVFLIENGQTKVLNRLLVFERDNAYRAHYELEDIALGENLARQVLRYVDDQWISANLQKLKQQ